ncbi:MAG: hypothetical protein JWM85_3578 [Acidimicrobiaceae bacterium]|nr:hypothetical protein [Acidimicrobiaceae bacterium]
MAGSLPRPGSEPGAPGSLPSRGESAPEGALISGERVTERREVVGRRTAAALAGYRGDETGARLALGDPAGPVRAAALGALVRLGVASTADAERALADPDPAVRTAACELVAGLPGTNYLPLLSDPEPAVAEAAAFALGERSEPAAIPALAEVAGHHEDALCRESAVAALGAIAGAAHEAIPAQTLDEAKFAVLAALSDQPAVRRRAVVALAAFEGDDVEAALTERLADRDWQVRQAAEDVLGAGREDPRLER